MANLPDGTVTFLFTDIEGSTARWEHDPAAMREDLARHDQILRRAIEGQSGAVFKTVGDAFYAVFPAAVNAVAAALMGQRALCAEHWTGATPLRVRMALHTGEADLRNHDYFGPALTRVARLLAVAHGGQILLTGAVETLVHDRLPPHVSLRDLGEHRLRDLDRRERIYQVVAAGVPGDFPPIRTPDIRPSNLTMPPTPLVGRRHEMRALRGYLTRDRARLVTLTGPGGTGKTRLAVEIATEMTGHFADGVFFVELEAIEDGAFVPAAIAATLGVRESQGQPLADVLAGYLHDLELLLVLDNFEQVIGAAPFVADLLARCPHLTVLVTSRERLRLRGDKELPVPPLPVTLPDSEAPDREPDRRGALPDAIQLFVDRAREVRPGFTLTDATASIVREICARLDGLPLALELAATRIRMLSPAALLARLGERTAEASLHLLRGGSRDLSERQQTLWNTIDWSYRLLDAREQIIFRRLSVFGGGCTVEAATALLLAAEAQQPTDGEPISEGDLLDALASLVDKSLLHAGETGDGEPYLTMLQTIRAYGLEQLRAAGELDALEWNHAALMLDRVEEAAAGLGTAQARRWRGRLDDEYESIRAALRWFCENAAVEPAARVTAALHDYWFAGGWLSEGLHWCRQVLSLPGLPDLPARHVPVLLTAGRLAGYQGDQGTAVAWLETCVALCRGSGDHLMLGRSLAALGRLSIEAPQQARPVLEESIALLRDLRDHRWLAAALGYLGAVARREQDDEAARTLFEESLALTHETGDPWAAATPLANLAALLDRHGDTAAARSLYEESLRLMRETGDSVNVVSVLNNLALLLIRNNEAEPAAACLLESLDRCRRLGARSFAIESVQILAFVPFVRGQPRVAARVLAAAEAAQEALGKDLPATHAGLYRSSVAAVRRALGDAAFLDAWTEGRSLSLDGAIRQATASLQVALVEV